MSHTVFALAADRERCLDTLFSAGFRRDEISLLAQGADGEPASAWAGRTAAVVADGPMAGWLRGTLSVVAALTSMGLPIWAAHRYEEGIGHGGELVAVHTDNGWEVDTISDLLKDGGCQTVVLCRDGGRTAA